MTEYCVLYRDGVSTWWTGPVPLDEALRLKHSSLNSFAVMPFAPLETAECYELLQQKRKELNESLEELLNEDLGE